MKFTNYSTAQLTHLMPPKHDISHYAYTPVCEEVQETLNHKAHYTFQFEFGQYKRVEACLMQAARHGFHSRLTMRS